MMFADSTIDGSFSIFIFFISKSKIVTENKLVDHLLFCFAQTV